MPDSRLVIFDFCGTLIRFQTADRYVRFCVERLKANKSVQRRKCYLLDCVGEDSKKIRIDNK